MPNNLNEYQTASSFRKFLQSQYDDVLDVSSDCASFMSCNGYYGKILTQIRLGLSPLKIHLFRYQFSDNPFCPSCNNELETISHYFLFCTCYVAPRTVLFEKMIMLITDWNSMKNIDKMDILIRGENLNSGRQRNNILIFKAVQLYIQATRRFV